MKILKYIIPACCTLLLFSCQSSTIKETVEVIIPFQPKYQVDTLYWETAPVKREIPNLTDQGTVITTINSTQLRVSNYSSVTLQKVTILMRIRGISETINVAFIDQIPPYWEMEFIPTFVQHEVILPTTSGKAVKLFLPSISQNGNTTFTCETE